MDHPRREPTLSERSESKWTEPLTFEDLCEIEKSTALLERHAPWWEPGKATGYHAITYGPLIGEIIRRVTGKSLGRFFAEEVAAPLGGDYHIGTGPEYDSRVAAYEGLAER